MHNILNIIGWEHDVASSPNVSPKNSISKFCINSMGSHENLLGLSLTSIVGSYNSNCK